MILVLHSPFRDIILSILVDMQRATECEYHWGSTICDITVAHTSCPHPVSKEALSALVVSCGYHYSSEKVQYIIPDFSVQILCFSVSLSLGTWELPYLCDYNTTITFSWAGKWGIYPSQLKLLTVVDSSPVWCNGGTEQCMFLLNDHNIASLLPNTCHFFSTVMFTVPTSSLPSFGMFAF